MLVAPADTLTVSEVFDLTRFGELTLSEGGLLVQPTELARPGTPEAEAIATGNTLRRIILDDGGNDSADADHRARTSRRPRRSGSATSSPSPSRWCSATASASGACSRPTAPPRASSRRRTPGPAAPDAVGGDVQVGAFNVLNYFLTWTGSGRPRGARARPQFEKQADKIVPGDQRPRRRRRHAHGDRGHRLHGLHARQRRRGAGRPGRPAERRRRRPSAWAYVPLPAGAVRRRPRRDPQRDHLPARRGRARRRPGRPGRRDVWFNAREPHAQTFASDEGDALHRRGQPLQVQEPRRRATGDNVDAGDGQGACNGDRTRQAASLADVHRPAARRRPATTTSCCMGDLNAYTQEDPIERAARRPASPTSATSSTRAATATCSTTSRARSTTRWPPTSLHRRRSPTWRTGTSTRSSPSPTSTSATRRSTPPTRTAPATTTRWCSGLDLEARDRAGARGLLPGQAGDHRRWPGPRRPGRHPGRDVIVARGGNDRVEARGGNDLVCAGGGDDRVLGGAGDDRVFGQAGDDRLLGGAGADSLLGGPGADALAGRSGRDRRRPRTAQGRRLGGRPA